jgi:hypothetical protein
MIILTAIALIEAILLAATVWSATRRRPARARLRVGRGDGGRPHAL